MFRSESIMNLRPSLVSINKDLLQSPIEKIMHLSFRPILKFQNDIIVIVFTNYLKEKKISWDISSKESKKLKINQILQKDLKIRNTLIGMTIGLLNENEMEIYLNNESQLRKRLLSMLSERILDHFK